MSRADVVVVGASLAGLAIAADLAMKTNGVKTLLQRARRALRECLERSER